jgi:hypothetical protein
MLPIARLFFQGDKDKIQEKLKAGELPSESQTSAVSDGNEIKGLVGDRVISLDPSSSFVRVKGSPIADWSHGVASDADHYLDTGSSSLKIRTDLILRLSQRMYR